MTLAQATNICTNVLQTSVFSNKKMFRINDTAPAKIHLANSHLANKHLDKKYFSEKTFG
jgi:hypothetical protein